MDGFELIMAKKAKTVVSAHAVVTSNITHVSGVSSSDFVNDGSRDYAIYTAQTRAIPSCCDGMKDCQRKALWLMRNKTDKLKTVSLSGQLISENLYVHGDVSASETISRLAAPYLNNIPMFDGIGAFGTRVGPDSWGAPRYTYVKRGKLAQSLLYNDLDIVPQRPNYDGSTQEPVNFLPLIPLVLLNGVSGIAVGWSTDILPHDLNDIVDATLSAIDGKDINDFLPSYNNFDITVNQLATNQYEFQGKVTIESATSIHVTELPPDLSLEKFKARLNIMEDNGQINTYIDRSSKSINIEIKFKRGSIDSWTEQDAIDFLKLKTKSTQRLVVLDFNNKSIKQYDTKVDLIKAFVDWRLTWYNVRYTKLIADCNYDLNWNLALKQCVDMKLPAFLGKANNRAEIIDKITTITASIAVDADQIDRIAALPSYRWAADSYASVIENIKNLHVTVSDYQAILSDPKKMRAIYRREVAALKKL